ncbi:hypothetical protein LTR84_010910 [Exophiala bonariae]|uniref:Uncharacterized protein n=1 Tax=Exophiala bonariae TaxID=1690606 RepID=A0AAV9NLE7_9EURO|nr:hypothetical protein LTR84_010910 [Exophiala bonariae]
MSTPDNAAVAAARTAAMAKVQEVLDIHVTGFKGYDVELMTKLVLLDAGPEGRVVWELDITDFYSNANGMSAYPGFGDVVARPARSSFLRRPRIYEQED